MSAASSDLVAGELVDIAPLVRRILAPNPGMMTGPGTNTYLLGTDEIAVIDPGPADDVHLDRIADSGNGRIRWIFVTHTHSDHSPGVAGLKERTDAEVLGFAERDCFAPDRLIGDGFVLDTAEFRLRALHTPGHASNHLCYLLEQEQLLFSGDHVMNGSTVVVAPPDGDMAAYLGGITRLQAMDPPLRLIAPGHGPLVVDPAAKLQEYLTHRTAREEAILQALVTAGTATAAELVAAIYVDVPAALHEMAKYSVWAHLRKLHGERRVTAEDADDVDSRWEPSAA